MLLEVRLLKEFIATNLALLTLALPVRANGAVFEAVDLLPGEGRPVFKASAQDLTLRASPSNSSRVSHRMIVQRNQLLGNWGLPRPIEGCDGSNLGLSQLQPDAVVQSTPQAQSGNFVSLGGCGYESSVGNGSTSIEDRNRCCPCHPRMSTRQILRHLNFLQNRFLHSFQTGRSPALAAGYGNR